MRLNYRVQRILQRFCRKNLSYKVFLICIIYKSFFKIFLVGRHLNLSAFNIVYSSVLDFNLNLTYGCFSSLGTVYDAVNDIQLRLEYGF